MDRRILAVLLVLLLAAVAILATYVAVQRSPGWSVTKYLDNYEAVAVDSALTPTTLRSFDQGEIVVIRDKIVTVVYDPDENETSFSFLYEGSTWTDPDQRWPMGAPDLDNNLWSVTINGNWADDYDNGDTITLVGLVRQWDNYSGYTIEYVDQWGVQA